MADTTNQTLTQEFYAHFQSTRSELITRLDAVKLGGITRDASDQLSLDTAKLRKELTDATAYLPSYDQRQCELQLKELEKSLQDLRTAAVPKAKFAFKRNANKPSPSASPAQEHPIRVSTPIASTLTASGSSFASSVQLSSGLTLSGHSHQFLTLASLPAPPSSSASDLTISDLDSCVVNLLPPPDSQASAGSAAVRFTALHVRNLRRCVLIMPSIDGSALLHDMSHCIVVLGCHQYRMHTSSRVDVYLAISSSPIIEHCTGIRFAGYPPTLRPAHAGAVSMPASSHLSVQDFTHIRATPSPNWTALPEEDTPAAAGWQKTSGIPDQILEVDAVLDELLP